MSVHRLSVVLGLVLLVATSCRANPEKTDFDEDGYTADEDCNDTDADIHPGAAEVCDGIDNNCSGEADELGAEGGTTYYVDADGDGFGVDGDGVQSCDPLDGYALATGDCDDADVHYNPDALESDCDDPNDYNCDGSVGFADADGDGFPACRDCDDAVAETNPDADEICDTVDNDCDGDIDENAVDAVVYYVDADGDGWGNPDVFVEECDLPDGYADRDGDCDDVWAAANPEGTEVCDGHDNDCNGDTDGDDAADRTAWFADSDGDGFGDASDSALACDQPTGYVADEADCDDAAAAVNPDADEECDTVDNDCDGEVDEDDAIDASTYYLDADGDGQGTSSVSTQACSEPAGYSSSDTDCNDGSASAYDGATEVCDSLDNDCDGSVDEDDASDAGTWYEDSDGDGAGNEHSSDIACDAPSGYVGNDLDCDDDDVSQIGCDWAGEVILSPCGASGYLGPDDADCVTEYTGEDWAAFVSVSSGIQELTIADPGWYAITVAGAQGGSGTTSYDGGYGAELYGEFWYDAGDVLQVGVGQEGSSVSSNGGGGGGTFVVDDSGAPVIIAAGGGGIRASASQDGCDGVVGQYAVAGSGGTGSSSCTVKTSELGYGGVITSTYAYGAGGAGFYGDGEDDVTSTTVWGSGGLSWSNGLEGGEDAGFCSSDSHGGFGGGGSGAGCNGGGGGGGYSGGDGGWIAGGGGSYNSGTNTTGTDGNNPGDGWMTIERL